jgi:ribosomal protein L11 methyltransferase
VTEKQFLQIQLHAVSSVEQDLLTQLCFEHGCLGISEDLQFEQPEGIYDPVTKETPEHNLVAYFDESPQPQFYLDLREQFPHVEWVQNFEPHRDWLEEWKKGFTSFPLVADIWVVPSWLTPPTGIRAALRIDPGMAFGTGTHATTQLAAELLMGVVQNSSFSTLDVGTGTGILALLARQLGAQRIVAHDIDEDACMVAKENLLLNSMPDVEVVCGDLEELDEQFDIVVANIIDGVLVDLQDLLQNKVKPGGALALSGILCSREAIFLSDWQTSEEFELETRLVRGEWLGFCFRKMEQS